MSNCGTYIGVDPGKSGAVCVLTVNCGEIESIRWTTGKALYAFPWWKRESKRDAFRCCLERVWGFVKGGRSAGAASMFNFGQAFGEVIGILESHGVDYKLVLPRDWQSKVPMGELQNVQDNKERSRLSAIMWMQRNLEFNSTLQKDAIDELKYKNRHGHSDAFWLAYFAWKFYGI